MAPTIAMAHKLPPLGAKVAITDPAAPPTFVASVDSHLGRYFYAGGYRFHVADDSRPIGARRAWSTAAATVVLLSPEESEAAALPVAASAAPAAASVTWIPATEPTGPVEPQELW